MNRPTVEKVASIILQHTPDTPWLTCIRAAEAIGQMLSTIQDDIEFENEELRQALSGPSVQQAALARVFNISPSESKLLATLLSREIATREALYMALYDQSGTVSEKVIQVWISRIRTRLRPHGIAIATMPYHGYLIEPEHKTLIRSKLNAFFQTNGRAAGDRRLGQIKPGQHSS